MYKSDEWLATFFQHVREMTDAGQRLGQAMFNALYVMDWEAADAIFGSEADPYHNDNRIAEFERTIFGWYPPHP